MKTEISNNRLNQLVELNAREVSAVAGGLHSAINDTRPPSGIPVHGASAYYSPIDPEYYRARR